MCVFLSPSFSRIFGVKFGKKFQKDRKRRMNELRQPFEELVRGAQDFGIIDLLSAWRVKQFENSLKQFETELIGQ
jgi:hypothetical protein